MGNERDRLIEEFSKEFPELGGMDLDDSLQGILEEFLTEFPTDATWTRLRETNWGKVEEELSKLIRLAVVRFAVEGNDGKKEKNWWFLLKFIHHRLAIEKNTRFF